ncbi:MAG: 4-hydroxy-tetrahydrodipicolinate synthase [Prochlorothrix sp.]
MTFGRVLTAMITPFHPDGSVNYGVAEKLAAHLADHGTDTVVVCGTTGESPTLTWAEEEDLFKVVQQAVGGKAKVMAGTGSNSTQEAIEATRSAAKLGLDGSLQVVPYYNKPSQEGLYQHFRTIAQACPDLPIMLYNVPGRTSCNLLPETVGRLAVVENIVAIKEASGNLDQASAVRGLVPGDFGLYSGDDSLTMPLLAVGGQGVVSVASHLVGDRLQTMIQAFEQGQVQAAIQLHQDLFSLFKTLFISTNPVPVKTALALQGWAVGNLRLPLVPMPEEQVEILRSVMQKLDLLPSP